MTGGVKKMMSHRKCIDQRWRKENALLKSALPWTERWLTETTENYRIKTEKETFN
jgi:hypothetical protein